MLPEQMKFDDNYREEILRSVRRGAFLRSAGSLIMWSFCLFSYVMDKIQLIHFLGVSCAVLFLILIGPPALYVLKRINNNYTFSNFRLFFNCLDGVGYTAVIYSLGGFEAIHLTLLYALLITYLGILSSHKESLILALFCSTAFGTMVILEAFNAIPSLIVDPNFNPSIYTRLIRSSIVVALLFIFAYVSSSAAGRLRRAHNRIQNQKNEIEAKNIKLENEIDERKRIEKDREKLIRDLQKAIQEIDTLRDILPICCFCKKIRDDKGYWEQVDVYIRKHLKTDLSHGICPDCAKKHYPDIFNE